MAGFKRNFIRGKVMVSVSSRMGAYAAAAKDMIWAAIQDTGTALMEDVKGGKNQAPKDTGELRRSYHLVFFKDKMKLLVSSDNRIAYYALYVEYGTVNGGWGRNGTRAQPHLRPAAETQRPELPRRIRANLSKIKMKAVVT